MMINTLCLLIPGRNRFQASDSGRVLVAAGDPGKRHFGSSGSHVSATHWEVADDH